jgi:hypothetical protein
MDKGLRFTSHLQYVSKKGTKFALVMARVGKSTWGAPFKHIRQLFTAVVEPRTDYAASIWHRPEDYVKSQAAKQEGKPVTVQRLAMKAISGCFKTTPTSALQVETGLARPHLRLRSKILRTFTQMQTVPANHPLAEWVQKAIRNKGQNIKFISNLGNIVRRFPDVTATSMETIVPRIRPPWWMSGLGMKTQRHR